MNKSVNNDKFSSKKKYYEKSCTESYNGKTSSLCNPINNLHDIFYKLPVKKNENCCFNESICKPSRIPIKRFNQIYTTLSSIQIDVLYTHYTTINYIPWLSKYNSANGKLSIIFDVEINNIPLSIKIYDNTHNNILAELNNITNTDFYELIFNSPKENSRLIVMVKKDKEIINMDDKNPQIYGIILTNNF